MTRVLVTGGAGFIGSNLTDRLLAEGHEVTVVDDLSTGKLHNLQTARRNPDLPLSFQRVDITSNALERVFAKAEPEVVLHLAAQIDVRHSVEDPVHDAMVNVIGTVNVLEASRRHGVRKVVYTSSGGTIYGEPAPEDLPIDETFPGHPGSPYGASKRGAEEYLYTYESLYELRWTSLALANVYGRRQDPHGEAGVVSIFGSRMLKGEPVTIFGDGEQSRDFVYVDDVVHAFVLAMDRGDGQRFNIGTSELTTVNTLFAELKAVTDYPHEPTYGEARPGELRAISVDTRRAAAELGWKPWTTLREGLTETMEWLRF